VTLAKEIGDKMNEESTATVEPVGMSITSEELEYCKFKVGYTADPEAVKKLRVEALGELRHLPVPGFRPGKATDLAIRLKYKDRIEEWVKQKMLSVANDDILFDTKIRPIGSPNVESSKLAGSKFTCQLVYLDKPKFELKQYDGLEIHAPHMEKTEEEIAEFFLQDLRKKHGDVRPYEDGDFVQPNDKITLTYDVPSLEKKEEGQLYIVGSNALLGLDDNLMGMAPGESRKFTTEIDGKEGECEVTLHMGMKNTMCAADDTLAQKCGVKDFDELIKTVRTIAHNQYTTIRNSKIAEQIKNRLVADHDFDPPTWLYDMDAQHIASQEGVKWDELEEDVKNKYLERGKNNSKFTLILDSIAQAEPDVDVADAEAIEGIKNSLMQRGLPNVEAWLQQSVKNGTLHGMVAQFKTDFTMQWLVEHTKVIE